VKFSSKTLLVLNIYLYFCGHDHLFNCKYFYVHDHLDEPFWWSRLVYWINKLWFSLGTLIWDNLMWKKNGSLQNLNLGNLLVGNWKKFKINSSFSFLAKRELTNLLRFFFQSPFPWYINSNISILYLKYYNLENSICFM